MLEQIIEKHSKDWVSDNFEDWKITGCSCEAREFRRYTPCKHMISIHNKLGHSL